MPSVDLAGVVQEGAAKLGCPLSDAQASSLLFYLELLVKWNDVYNLTAVREPVQMVTHHLLDSLSVLAPLRRHVGDRPARLLDVGSGAGLPGIVLAVMQRQLEVSCVDAAAKKVSFMRQAVAELKLRNVVVQHARSQTLETAPFDLITARAFSSLAELVAASRRHLVPGGSWLAMKGKHPAEEIAMLPADVRVFHVEPLQVPGLRAERCLVWMHVKSPGE